MDLDMWQRLRHRFPTRITGVASAKLVAVLVILVVPGGLMLPLCYAAYAAIVNGTARRSIGVGSAASTTTPPAARTRFLRAVSRHWSN